MAPCDVCLNADEDDDTVVQPDVLVVCDEEKLENGKYVNGIPNMAIEILSLSPSSLKKDRIIKHNKYQSVGINEFWIVDPMNDSVAVHILENKKYVRTDYAKNDVVAVKALPGLEIDLSKVF